MEYFIRLHHFIKVGLLLHRHDLPPLRALLRKFCKTDWDPWVSLLYSLHICSSKELDDTPPSNFLWPARLAVLFSSLGHRAQYVGQHSPLSSWTLPRGLGLSTSPEPRASSYKTCYLLVRARVRLGNKALEGWSGDTAKPPGLYPSPRRPPAWSPQSSSSAFSPAQFFEKQLHNVP